MPNLLAHAYTFMYKWRKEVRINNNNKSSSSVLFKNFLNHEQTKNKEVAAVCKHEAWNQTFVHLVVIY